MVVNHYQASSQIVTLPFLFQSFETMSLPFSYSTQYTLDKSHFSETFDESITPSKRPYLKVIIFGLLGITFLLFVDASPYTGWFMIGLSALEYLSVRYKKPWWLMRQLISKAANSELTLTIDELGISSQSLYVKSNILWADVTQLEQTPQGWLIYHPAGKNYISKRCLSSAANTFLLKQSEEMQITN